MLQRIVKLSIYGLVFLMPLFFLPFTVEALDFNKTYLLIFLTALGIFAWLAKMIFQDKKVRIKFSRFDFVILLFLVLTTLSAIFSQDRTASLLGEYGRFWPSLAGTLALAGFYLLLANNLAIASKNPEEENSLEKYDKITAPNLLKAFFISCSITVAISYFSILGVWGFLAGKLKMGIPQVMLNTGFNTVAGTLEGFSMFLAFAMVLALALVSFRFSGERRSQVFYYFFIIASLGMLAITGFWAAWLCLAISLLLFLGFSIWKRIFKEDISRISFSVAVLIIAFVFLFINPLKAVLPKDNIINKLAGETLLRQGPSWDIGFAGLKGSPVLGVGVGNFSYAFSKFKPQTFLKDPFWQVRLNRPGNHMAEVLATTGAVGTVSYFGMIIMFLIISYLAIVRKNQKNFLVFLAPFVALLAGQFLYYQNLALAFSFWMILAISVAIWKENSNEKVFDFKDFPEAGLILNVSFWIVLVGFAFLGFSLTKNYIADASYRDYLKNPQKNLAKLERAVSLSPNRPVYHLSLASFYLNGFAQEALNKQPDIKKAGEMVSLAIEESRKAAEVAPNRVDVQEASAVIYREIQGLAKGASDWAIKSFEKALALEPNNPGFLTEIGNIYLANNDSTKAKEFFEKAISLKPDYILANLQLALLDEKSGNQENGQLRMEKLAKDNPQSVETRFQLGRFYYNNKDYAKAESEFLVALSLFPNHSNSLYALGLTYEQQREKEKAIQIMEKVLLLNPDNKNVVEKIAQLKGGASSPEAIPLPDEGNE